VALCAPTELKERKKEWYSALIDEYLSRPPTELLEMSPAQLFAPSDPLYFFVEAAVAVGSHQRRGGRIGRPLVRGGRQHRIDTSTSHGNNPIGCYSFASEHTFVIQHARSLLLPVIQLFSNLHVLLQKQAAAGAHDRGSIFSRPHWKR
jgi:hypothetical protein